QLVNVVLQLIRHLNDALAVFVEHFAFASEAKFLFAPFDEQGFELSFQGADLLADGGLRYPVELRALGETFRFGEVAKDFQAVDLHEQSAQSAAMPCSSQLSRQRFFGSAQKLLRGE